MLSTEQLWKKAAMHTLEMQQVIDSAEIKPENVEMAVACISLVFLELNEPKRDRKKRK